MIVRKITTIDLHWTGRPRSQRHLHGQEVGKGEGTMNRAPTGKKATNRSEDLPLQKVRQKMPATLRLCSGQAVCGLYICLMSALPQQAGPHGEDHG
jgi:hypothetical protein